MIVDCQGRAFYFDNLFQDILAATGSSISSAYFQMLEMDISEVLYHLNTYIQLYMKQHPETQPKEKLNKWGFKDVEFDELI